MLCMHRREMFLAVFCACLATSFPHPVSVPEREISEYFYNPGDFVLGGLFSFHGGPSSAICSWNVSTEFLMWSETMLFAMEQINQRADILPHHKLGFYLRDDCDNEEIALWSTLQIAQGNTMMTNCTVSNSSSKGQIVGIVGPADSALSLFAAKVGSLHELPVMSIYGTSHELSDGNRFPFFLRAVPPDTYQVEAILDILAKFDWLYTALIFSADSYGINGGTELVSRGTKRGVCFTFTSHLPVKPSSTQLDALVSQVTESKELTVIVMFASGDLVSHVLNAIAAADFHRRIIWIGTDAWPRISLTGDPVLAPVAEGSIIVRLYKADIPDLHDYIVWKDSNLVEVSPWLQEWFEFNTGCTSMHDCPLLAELNDVAIVHSVYAFAYALHNYVASECKESSNCKIDTRKLMGFLHNVSFDIGMGHFGFDADGEPAGRYLLKQIQYQGIGYSQVDIGEWDTYKREQTNRWILNHSNIRWGSGWDAPPVSDCYENCESGSIPVSLLRKCCTGCAPCLLNQIVNGTECLTCPDHQTPSEDRLLCTDIVPRGVSWDNPAVLTTVVLAIIGLILVALASAGLLYYRNHVLIKASSRELCAVNILGLVLTFSTIFLLYLTPTVASCAVSEFMISVSIAILFATSFLKANRIYRVFKASKKTIQKPRMISPRDQLALALTLIAIQILLASVAGFVNPPSPEVSDWPPWELYCPVSLNGVVCACYNLVLIVLCCYFAFRARKVPDNYNESKFIAISVYSTVLVCLVAVPVNATASATILKVVSWSFALIFNGYLTLMFIYFPKLYSARFRRQDSPGMSPLVRWDAREGTKQIGRGDKLFILSNKVRPFSAQDKRTTEES